MLADRALRVPGARLAPGEPLEQHRVTAEPLLELVLGLEAGNELRHAYSTRSAAPVVAGAGEHDASLTVGAHGHEVRAVLVGAGLVVDEHEVKVVVGEVGPLLAEGGTRGLLHHAAVPAAVGGPGLLERRVGGRHVLGVMAGLAPVAPAHAEQPAHEDEQARSDDDEDDRGDMGSESRA